MLTADASPTTTSDLSVNWGSAPDSAVAQDTTKASYQSTDVNATPTVDQDTDIDYTVAITNTLLQISPTGIVTRYAPYDLILVAGVVLLVISKKRKKNTDEE